MARSVQPDEDGREVLGAAAAAGTEQQDTEQRAQDEQGPSRPDPVIARILLACVRNEPLSRSLDLDAAGNLVELAWHHRCLPFLSPHVESGQLRVPEQVETYLRDVHMTWAMHQLRIQSDLAWFAQTIEGIPWLLIKGPALAYTIYEQPHHRWYGDIDVVVPPERLDEVTARLQDAGGRVHVRDWAHLIEARAGEFTLAAPGETTIDLHWRLLNDHRLRTDDGLTFADLYDAGRSIEVANLEVRTLGFADTLSHLALHTCGGGGDRLLWYVDVDRAYREMPVGPAQLEARAGAHGAALALRVVLDRCRVLLGTPVVWHRPAGPGTLLWQGLARTTGEFWGPPRTLGAASPDRLVMRSIRSTSGRSALAALQKSRQHTAPATVRSTGGSTATLEDLIRSVVAANPKADNGAPTVR